MRKSKSDTRPRKRKLRHARVRELRRASDCEPGITRRRAGQGFVYLDAKSARVRDAATLARIRALAIPPAYEDVWICADRRGHLQATGRDARGRKQYRYHVAWQHRRDAKKYRRLLRFAERLPVLRARLRRDRRLEGLSFDINKKGSSGLNNKLLLCSNNEY